MTSTAFYAAFINMLRIGSKFCLAGTLDTFNAFTVNYTMKDQQQRFPDCQIKTIRPPKTVIEVDISEKQQKLLTAAFRICLSLACKVMLLSLSFPSQFHFLVPV